ncbi:apolipoprotein N-acyltransferase [Pacificimonas flava]|nr:apolipoprotein N-acyltransferase [Pacificimonas flava]
MGLWRRRALLFAAGGLGGLGFAPFGLWPVTLVSLAVLCLVVETGARNGAGRGSVFVSAWAWAFGNFLAGQYWIAHAFQFQANMPAWLGWVAVVGLSMFMATYPAVAAALASRFRKAPMARALAFAGAWMLTEWLRGYLMTGFGWNPLGITTLSLGPAAQGASWVGALGMSGVMLLAGYAIMLTAAEVRRHWREGWVFAPLAEPLGGGRALLAPLATALILGWLTQGDPTPSDTRVDIVQANIPQEEKYAEGAFYRNLQRYIDLSPPPGGEARLLIWPEAAIPRTLDTRPDLRRDLAVLLLGERDLFLTGALKLVPGQSSDDPWAGLNSLYAIGPDGGIHARYDKQRLVPYGEYLPLRPVLSRIGLDSFAPSSVDTYAGTRPRVMALPGFPDLVAMICYEAVYAEQADGATRPAWLLNVSNDAWFSDGGAAMHLAHARLRAIEQGLPLVRSTPTGISAVIDPYGEVIASLPRHEAGVIQASLPLPRAETLFARTGNALPIALALFLLAGALALPARSRRS